MGNQGRYRSRGFNYRKFNLSNNRYYRVEEFLTLITVQYSAGTAKVSVIRPRHVGPCKTKCLICGDSHHHKGCPNKEKKQPKCANRKGPHVASYKGCPAYKKQASREHVVDSQKSYASIVCQKLPHNPKIRHSHFKPNNL